MAPRAACTPRFRSFSLSSVSPAGMLSSPSELSPSCSPFHLLEFLIYDALRRTESLSVSCTTHASQGSVLSTRDTGNITTGTSLTFLLLHPSCSELWLLCYAVGRLCLPSRTLHREHLSLLFILGVCRMKCLVPIVPRTVCDVLQQRSELHKATSPVSDSAKWPTLTHFMLLRKPCRPPACHLIPSPVDGHTTCLLAPECGRSVSCQKARFVSWRRRRE